jgi:hypothetical protein
MKKTLIFVLLFSSFLELNAQVKGLQISKQKEQRSLTMFFGNLSDKSAPPAVFIDGKQVSFIELLSINSKFIETYSVEKKTTTIESKEYKEQLYIKTKNNYKPKRTSLKDIRKKYVKDQNLPCVYFMDGRLAKVVEVDIFLDENNILEITCHLYENIEENLKLNIIEIFTRSEENLKKADEIIIR